VEASAARTPTPEDSGSPATLVLPKGEVAVRGWRERACAFLPVFPLSPARMTPLNCVHRISDRTCEDV